MTFAKLYGTQSATISDLKQRNERYFAIDHRRGHFVANYVKLVEVRPILNTSLWRLKRLVSLSTYMRYINKCIYLSIYLSIYTVAYAIEM